MSLSPRENHGAPARARPFAGTPSRSRRPGPTRARCPTPRTACTCRSPGRGRSAGCAADVVCGVHDRGDRSPPGAAPVAGHPRWAFTPSRNRAPPTPRPVPRSSRPPILPEPPERLTSSARTGTARCQSGQQFAAAEQPVEHAPASNRASVDGRNVHSTAKRSAEPTAGSAVPAAPPGAAGTGQDAPAVETGHRQQVQDGRDELQQPQVGQPGGRGRRIVAN